MSEWTRRVQDRLEEIKESLKEDFGERRVALSVSIQDGPRGGFINANVYVVENEPDQDQPIRPPWMGPF